MNKSNNRTVFFGTPDLAVFVLEELALVQQTPSLIITAPDKPAGRTLALTPPMVKVWAQEHDVPVLQISSYTAQEQIEVLMNTEWDLFIVAAYNSILPASVLQLPQCGVLNVHPSLLPQLRGSSPIRTAIRDDLRDAVGISIIKLDERMDHGPIVAQATIELPFWPEKGRVLDEILFREGGRLLAEVIPAWIRKEITPQEQDHTQATYTKKIMKADGLLDLADDSYKNYRTFCAYDGWPGTFFFAEHNGVRVRLKITDAQYIDGKFVIVKVIPEGKKEVPYEVWHHNFFA